MLQLARSHAFARPLVNSGRLSTAVHYRASPLSTPDGDDWKTGVPPGAPMLDAPILRNGTPAWLSRQVGDEFALLLYQPSASQRTAAATLGVRLLLVDDDDVADPQELIPERYGLVAGAAVLFRPDQYVAARWRRFDAEVTSVALRRARGLS